jgi:hypothetical protein
LSPAADARQARPADPPLPAPQLGANLPVTTTSVTRPTYVVTDTSGTRLSNCRAIAANANHTLFLTTEGVFTAGRNGCEHSAAG